MTDSNRLPILEDNMAEHYGHLPVTTVSTADVLANYATGDDRTWPDELADIDIADLLTQVRRDGRIMLPITLGTDGRVLDGHHRVLVAQQLGLPTIPARIAHLEPRAEDQ